MRLTASLRRLGTAIGLSALVLGAGTATVATAPPAIAAPAAYTQCFPVYDQGGQIVDFFCIPVPVETHPCPHCPYTIGFDHLVLPADPWYVEDLGTGLGLLGQAALADPREAAQLRARAQDAFRSAAERLGQASMAVGEVGLADFEQLAINPEPTPWLVSAGIDLAGGLTLMVAALVEPEPDPWIDAAMRRFDAALDALTHQRVG